MMYEHGYRNRLKTTMTAVGGGGHGPGTGATDDTGGGGLTASVLSYGLAVARPEEKNC
jgi:hypothetical protein